VRNPTNPSRGELGRGGIGKPSFNMCHRTRGFERLVARTGRNVFRARIDGFPVYRFSPDNIALLQATAPAITALFLLFVALLRRAEQDWLVGILTPRKLSYERIRNRTSERAAALFAVAVLFAIAAVTLPRFRPLLANESGNGYRAPIHRAFVFYWRLDRA